MHGSAIAALLWMSISGIASAQPAGTPATSVCGEVVTVATHNGTTTRYSLARGLDNPAQDKRIVLLLFVGGGGDINLDGRGCPRSLFGNVLMRMRPLFHAAGMATAMVDATSGYAGGDGLAGFRLAPQHADDMGKVIADVRTRTNGSVWIVGHSRGTISAANAGARLSGPGAPDGVVVMSAMMIADARARKILAMQSVFDLPLEAIRMPLLVLGHDADNCVRSPAAHMAKITARTKALRQQVAVVSGGAIAPGRVPNLGACEVGEPHDFVGQDAEVGAGIIRFVRGASY